MNPTILARASKVVPDNQLLVNIVRLRVRQLSQGHRPLIAAPPGMGMADIALSEIAEDKISSAPSLDAVSVATPAAIINFPAAVPKKKAA
ncbi:MAG: DNA-directed RNA polymerase subunit omega [Chthoniobacterales bacterium]